MPSISPIPISSKSTLACPLCSQSNSLKKIFSGTHTLFKCPQCELIFSDRLIDPKFFDFYRNNEDHFYDRPYFQNANEAPSSDNPNYFNALSRTKSLLDAQNPTLLDIGCGTGHLLNMAKKIGFYAEGLEVSESISKFLSKDFKIHIYDGNHQHIPLMNPFDVVSAWDVLEHVPDPVSFLRSVKGLIRPGGKLIIRTINEDCLLSQFSLLLYKLTAGLFKSAANRMHEVYHVIYFSKKTLLHCLEKSGYAINDYWIGEFPADRATTSKFIQTGLKLVYFFQRLTGKTYEQYLIATPKGDHHST
ncbi:MAG: Ubiquinone biosynthesis O-methyltransferase [Elusimicrobia bacterium]|nr:Ubiquinone biosynthesis O-methyltransferase [Elusimicrobiota bacterium]